MKNKYKKIDKNKLKTIEELLEKKKITRKYVWEVYYHALYLNILKTANIKGKFDYHMQDVVTFSPSHYYKLMKNRTANSNNGVLLKSLDYDRHWKYYFEKPKDIDFSLKKNMIIWRGTTSGFVSRKPNRFDLVKKWFNKNENINVGFNNITLNSSLKLDKYVLDRVEPEEMLKYKYILSIEGNDKDSGLQWKLNSNSVVLMPRPTITSWLMETTLVPNYHYVLINDNYSDLYEKLEWCNKNQNRCIEIVKNANLFMKQFMNNNSENYIEKQVLNEYFRLVNN